jgi:transcriptional repressor NrdR
MNDKVIESRSLASGEVIRRRRECVACSYRFTSYERIEEKQLMVIKKQGRREPFDRQKLETKLQLALRKRPVSQLEIENVVNKIEEQALMQGKSTHEVTSVWVGEEVLRQLYELDRVAYVRFASVYRNFEDVEEFIEEIDALARRGGNPRE